MALHFLHRLELYVEQLVRCEGGVVKHHVHTSVHPSMLTAVFLCLLYFHFNAIRTVVWLKISFQLAD
jgi:hypothetical protein